MWFRIARFLTITIVAAGFAAAGVWSVRLGWADYWFRKETLAGTEKALAITPDQAAYYYRLALLTSDDHPARAIEALQRAVALNPADAHSWIELGLRYEAGGDYARAEQCLIRAVEEDAEYLPKWTLANHYFRRNDPPRFWFWAKQAAAMAYGDPLPLFRLCGQMEEDGDLIDRLAIRNPSVRASYLSYLVGQDRIDLVGSPSRRVLEDNRQSDTPLLLAVCDRLLDRSRVDEALDIWNKLAGTHRIPFGARSSAIESPLTNGAFTAAPTSQGFDWRLPEVDGISAASEESPGGLRLTFSGRQPERCDALVQYVPVQENRKYKLRFLYRTSGIAAGTGLTWRITDRNGARSWPRSGTYPRKTRHRTRFRLAPRPAAAWYASLWPTSGVWEQLASQALSSCDRSTWSWRTSHSVPLGRPAAFARDEVEERHEQQKSPGVEQDFPPPTFPLDCATGCFDLAVLRNLTCGSLFGRVSGQENSIATVPAAIRVPSRQARQMFQQTAPVGAVKMIGLAFGTQHKLGSPGTRYSTPKSGHLQDFCPQSSPAGRPAHHSADVAFRAGILSTPIA